MKTRLIAPIFAAAAAIGLTAAAASAAPTGFGRPSMSGFGGPVMGGGGGMQAPMPSRSFSAPPQPMRPSFPMGSGFSRAISPFPSQPPRAGFPPMRLQTQPGFGRTAPFPGQPGLSGGNPSWRQQQENERGTDRDNWRNSGEDRDVQDPDHDGDRDKRRNRWYGIGGVTIFSPGYAYDPYLYGAPFGYSGGVYSPLSRQTRPP